MTCDLRKQSTGNALDAKGKADVLNGALMTDIGEHIHAGDGMTSAFFTMAMCEVFHSFNMRSQRQSAVGMAFKNHHNWALYGAMLGSFLLTTALLEIPFLAAAFGFTPIGLMEYGIAIALAITVIPVVELVKLIQRSLKK